MVVKDELVYIAWLAILQALMYLKLLYEDHTAAFFN
jgi:hypothetical protein